MQERAECKDSKNFKARGAKHATHPLKPGPYCSSATGAATPGREPERDRVRGAAEFAALPCDPVVVTSAASSTDFPAASLPTSCPATDAGGGPKPTGASATQDAAESRLPTAAHGGG